MGSAAEEAPAEPCADAAPSSLAAAAAVVSPSAAGAMEESPAEPKDPAAASTDALAAEAGAAAVGSDVGTLHVSSKGFSKQTSGHVESWLAKISQVPLEKCFKLKPWGYAFVTVPLEHREAFQRDMQGVTYKNHPVVIKEGKPRSEGKRHLRGDDDAPAGKKPKLAKPLPEGHVPQLKDLRDRAKWRKGAHAKEESMVQKSAPLLDWAYETQLSMKSTYIKSAVRAFTKQVRKRCEDEQRDAPPWTTPEWIIGASAPHGCGCPLDEIIATPMEGIEGYRNKCEFTIGRAEGGDVEVGFVLRALQNGVQELARCDDLPHVPAPMKRLCGAIRDCVRGSSFPVFERQRGVKSGVWRVAMARLSPTGEMLVLMQTTTLSDDDRETLTRQLVEALFDKGLGVVSLHLQFNDDVTDAARPDAPLLHVHGRPRLVMPLLGLRFEIGPVSFFQSNTVTCANLYEKALDWLCPKENAVVLDVCCGVGTIGLCAAARCRRVIGIELVPEATESARQNAALNGIENAAFHAGRAEDVLPGILASLGPDVDDVCAIVDPPRPGLHSTVALALRGCSRLTRVVYISCNPDSLVDDVVRLTMPLENSLDPLVPTRAVAVDMFPHTLHCEMVLLLERSSRVPDPRGKARPRGAVAEPAAAPAAPAIDATPPAFSPPDAEQPAADGCDDKGSVAAAAGVPAATS
mmetsp:Transcript_19707/g.54132  ORF Transcript_19707/g.54132 Transcript_19707/m.54132 type:complete len:689 (+) Transcript_19707:104-2170(+)